MIYLVYPMVFGPSSSTSYIRPVIQNFGADLKYNQKMVVYSYDFHVIIVIENTFSKQVAIVVLSANKVDNYFSYP